MKNYLLFAGTDYYPLGGFADWIGGYSSIEEAKAAALSVFSKTQWQQIVHYDPHTGTSEQWEWSAKNQMWEEQ